MQPWREGGTGGDAACPVQPEAYPCRLEAGTPNVRGLAGLREGVRLILERGVETILPQERKLLAVFLGALKDPGRLRWYGADKVIAGQGGEGRVGLVSMNLPGLVPAELAAILDSHYGIAVRAGLHCAPYAHRHLGTFPEGAARISPGWQTTEEDLLSTATAMNEIASA